MDKLAEQLELLVKQNASLLTEVAALRVVNDELVDMVEDLTEAVNNLSLPYGDGFSDVN